MSAGLYSTHASHTLLVDADVVHGEQLLEQLSRAGFRTYLAVSWRAAHVALAKNLYDSCIVVAHLDRSEDLEHLDELRRAERASAPQNAGSSGAADPPGR